MMFLGMGFSVGFFIVYGATYKMTEPIFLFLGMLCAIVAATGESLEAYFRDVQRSTEK